MAVYNAIKYNVDFAGLAGSLIPISTFTSDGSDATASFTSGIDTTYKEYLFILNDIHPQNNDIALGWQANASGGSGYDETITSAAWYAYHYENNSGVQLAYSTGGDQAQGTAFQTLADSLGNGADEALSGYLRIYDPGNTTHAKHFVSSANVYMHSNGSMQAWRQGYINTATAITQIQFKFSSGEIQGGTIQMFGVH